VPRVAASGQGLLRLRALSGAEPAIVPGDTSLDAVGDVFRFPQAVPFTRVADHDRRIEHFMGGDALVPTRRRNAVVTTT
jgi:hypothetical protein